MSYETNRDDELSYLQVENDRLKEDVIKLTNELGGMGACHACEPIGIENQQLKERVDKLTNLLLKSRAMSSFSTAKWNEIRDEVLTELKME